MVVIDQRRFSFLPQIPLEDLARRRISGPSDQNIFIFGVEPDTVHHLPFRRHRVQHSTRLHVPDPRKSIKTTTHELRRVWC